MIPCSPGTYRLKIPQGSAPRFEAACVQGTGDAAQPGPDVAPKKMKRPETGRGHAISNSLYEVRNRGCLRQGKEPVSLLIQGAWVLTMNPQHEVFSPGAVALKGDEIVAVGPPAELKQRYAPAQAAGLPPGPDPPRPHQCPHPCRHVPVPGPGRRPAPGRMAQLITFFPPRAGSTAISSIGAPSWRWPRCCFPAPPPSPTCISLPTHVARAAAETGIRAVVGEVLYDFPSPNYGPPAAGLKFSEELCRA